MMKKILLLSLFLHISLCVEASNKHEFDYLIKIHIDMVANGEYKVSLPKSINSFYEDDKVGFKITINNPKQLPYPFFKIFYDAFPITNKIKPLKGAQDPIVIVPPPPGKAVQTSYEVIPKRQFLLDNSILGKNELKIFPNYSVEGDNNYISMHNTMGIINILPSNPHIAIRKVAASIRGGVAIRPTLESSCLVVNKGKYTSSSSKLHHYISTDKVLDDKDVLLVTKEIPALVSKEEEVLHLGYKHLPFFIEPNTAYYLIYKIEQNKSDPASGLPDTQAIVLLIDPFGIKQKKSSQSSKLSVDKGSVLKVAIYNQLGQLIKEYNTGINDNSCLKGLKSGMYYCHFYTKEGVVRKIVYKQ